MPTSTDSAVSVSQRFIGGERDAWILVAAQLPEQMSVLMEQKQQQLDDPAGLELYRDLAASIDWKPDDPRLPALSDRLVTLLEASYAADPDGWNEFDIDGSQELVNLLDSFFLDSVPAAPRFLELLEERGWCGWTKFERISST